ILRPSCSKNRTRASHGSAVFQGRYCLMNSSSARLWTRLRRIPQNAAYNAACQVDLPASFGPYTMVNFPANVRDLLRIDPKPAELTPRNLIRKPPDHACLQARVNPSLIPGCVWPGPSAPPTRRGQNALGRWTLSRWRRSQTVGEAFRFGPATLPTDA